MKFFKTILFSLIAVACCCCANTQTVGAEASAVVTITNSVAGDDATPALLAAIESLDEGTPSTIKFEKGTYHFYPDRAIERYTHSSNHGDYCSRIAMFLEGRENLTIDGGDSKFIFHNRIYPFFITKSKNITLKNFSIDYAERFSAEPVVIARNEVNSTFDIQIPEGLQFEIRNDVLYFVMPDYEFTIGQSILYDPVREMVAYNTEAYTNIAGYGKLAAPARHSFKYEMDSNDTYQKVRGREYKAYAEKISPRVVRIFGHNKKRLPPVGMILSCKGEQGVNRLAPAIKVEHTSNFLAENVTIYHASGMGFLGENCENVTLESCRVLPSEGYMVSTTADASHFVGCRGVVTLNNCTFRNQLDDACNIHGAYQPIVDIIDQHTIGVRMGHFQQQGFILAREGDSIGFVRIAESFHAYATATVESVKYINGRYNIITFKEPLPENLKQGDLAENLSAYPEIKITNNLFAGNRARGLLISSPKGTLIEGNTFSTEMEAILMPVESGHWYESGNAIDVVIRNNHFKDCNFGGMKRGVICFRTDDDLENPAFHNIEISKNTFDSFDSMIIEARNVEGLKIIDNQINATDTHDALFPDNPAFTFKYCTDVELKGNKHNGKAKELTDGNVMQ